MVSPLLLRTKRLVLAEGINCVLAGDRCWWWVVVVVVSGAPASQEGTPSTLLPI